MKKILSLLLAVMMIMALATTAFAANETAETTAMVSGATTVKLTKEYTVTGGNTFPAETLKFTSTPAAGNPDNTNVTIADVKVNKASGVEITVAIPSYSKVGVYNYTIKETAGNTQGVTYTTEELSIVALVTYNYKDQKLDVKCGVAQPEGGEKDSVFTNIYDMGSLEISKTVTGNLGDQNKEFNVTVTLTSDKPVWSDITYVDGADTKTITGEGWTGNKEVVITLKHSETVKFTNIPAGVTYTVVEDNYTGGDKNGENGYDAATYVFSDENKSIAKSDADSVAITNNKETTIATGVITDSAPYILLIAVCAVAAVLFIIKRRNTVDF